MSLFGLSQGKLLHSCSDTYNHLDFPKVYEYLSSDFYFEGKSRSSDVEEQQREGEWEECILDCPV